MQETAIAVTTPDEIINVAQDKGVRKILRDIFGEIQPRLLEGDANLASIFTPESASDLLARLADIATVLSSEDSYQNTLSKFQSRIEEAESIRDDVLRAVYAEAERLEQSYRQVDLFFKNADLNDGKQCQPVEFFVFNADVAAMKDPDSSTLGAIKKFVKSRNDNFNFRDDICNLVTTEPVSQPVREELEAEAHKWGMLLITTLSDEKSCEEVLTQFRPGGKYEFLKRKDEKAACDVVTVGDLKLRESHWFEQRADDGLYVPACLPFSGALARTDRRIGPVQPPIGTKFGKIVGVDKARIECTNSEMELLTMQMQVIPIVRDSENHLCFYGVRSLAEDEFGVYKFFSSYRVLCYLERRITTYLREVAGRVLTRQFLDDEIEKPLVRLLEQQKEDGTIMEYKLFVDKDSKKRMQGVCDISLEVMPTGPADTFQLKIDVPEFQPSGSTSGSGSSPH